MVDTGKHEAANCPDCGRFVRLRKEITGGLLWIVDHKGSNLLASGIYSKVVVHD
jgi:hypothetical protein